MAENAAWSFDDLDESLGGGAPNELPDEPEDSSTAEDIPEGDSQDTPQEETPSFDPDLYPEEAQPTTNSGEHNDPPEQQSKEVVETDARIPEFDSSEPLTEREKYLIQYANRLAGQVQQFQGSGQSPELNNSSEGTIDFVGEMEIDDILESKESLNAFMQKVYQAGVENTRNQLMPDIQQTVQQTVSRNTSLQGYVDTFYAQNEDLKDMKHTVALVAQEIINAEPEVPLNDLMERAAVQTRQLLRMPPPGQGPGATPAPPARRRGNVNNPGFANSSGRGRTPPQGGGRGALGDEIDDLINLGG